MSTSENGIAIQVLCLLLSWLVVMMLAKAMTGERTIGRVSLLLVMVRKWLMDQIPPTLIEQIAGIMNGEVR